MIIYSELDDGYLCIFVPYDKEFIARLIPVLREIYFNTFLPLLCSE